MASGIYALYWWKQDLVYIGQSQNIEDRTCRHLSLMSSNKHFNYKVQGAYNEFGKPDLIILELCESIYLDDLERYYVKEFTNTLNIAKAGQSMRGIHNFNAKYSKIQLLRAFSLLLKKCFSHKEISKRTGVSSYTIEDIVDGSKHAWIKEEYPTQWQSLRPVIREITLQSLTGMLYNTTNISSFVREHPEFFPNKMSAIKNLSAVALKVRKQHLGWHVV